MTSTEIRQTFLDFFTSRNHTIVPSAPIVIKNDPTLMFTNAGMNQFKEVFLGHGKAISPRVADTQKCLRVSGKHNDLEEVGVDTYHHTMFEMLGNWSFGDYFKKEAIDWAWELLTEVYKIEKDRLYVTVFEGEPQQGADGLPFDEEARQSWLVHLPEKRILNGAKKDNFWEMGETGPCGPCSEIHVDIRMEEERKRVDGSTLVNKGHPQVIEIWNLVFMEYNRLKGGKLEKLPAKHVDTGMGFERLCMVLQGKKSTYDTDVFSPLIKAVEQRCGRTYLPGEKEPAIEKINIAIRVIADHIRAITFTIADGQIPSNTGAGYVIRRILRRAVRYGYQELGLKEPFLYDLVDVLSKQLAPVFPELNKQQHHTKKVVKEEETSFLHTLEQGLRRIEIEFNDPKTKRAKKLSGEQVFELYDTYGFPSDLTALIAKEKNLAIDEEGFKECLEIQRKRSRAATTVDAQDWVIADEEAKKTDFTGYEHLEEQVRISRHRKVLLQGKEYFQIVFDKTPFYAESGGQVGDVGTLKTENGIIKVTDTKKEHNLIIHYAEKLPETSNGNFMAIVDPLRRTYTADNHSATHLLHAALRKILGNEVEQRGSLVHPDYLRFDFSHYSKVTDEELKDIESLVNQKIRENIICQTKIMPIEEAKKLGAMALFGEKYGANVRVVTMDKNYSIELCGGTHVKATGQIGFFKILSESALSAGIRRIEAVTAQKSEEYINSQIRVLKQAEGALKTTNILKSIHDLQEKSAELANQIEHLSKEQGKVLKSVLKGKIQKKAGMSVIIEKVNAISPEVIKDICFNLKQEIADLFLFLGAEIKGKANLFLAMSDAVVKEKQWNASALIKEFSKEIEGGGGGQPFYATAGGSKITGIEKALEKVIHWVEKQ